MADNFTLVGLNSTQLIKITSPSPQVIQLNMKIEKLQVIVQLLGQVSVAFTFCELNMWLSVLVAMNQTTLDVVHTLSCLPIALHQIEALDLNATFTDMTMSFLQTPTQSTSATSHQLWNHSFGSSALMGAIFQGPLKARLNQALSNWQSQAMSNAVLNCSNKAPLLPYVAPRGYRYIQQASVLSKVFLAEVPGKQSV